MAESSFGEHMLRGIARILEDEASKMQETEDVRNRLLSLLDELEERYPSNRDSLERLKRTAYGIEDIDDLRRLYHTLEQAL